MLAAYMPVLYTIAKVVLILVYFVLIVVMWFLIYHAGDLRRAFAEIKSECDNARRDFIFNAPRLPNYLTEDISSGRLLMRLAKSFGMRFLKRSPAYGAANAALKIVHLFKNFNSIIK